MGRIKRISPSKNTPVGTILSGSKNNLGYHCFGLRGNGLFRNIHGHILVATAFLEKLNPSHEVNHKDGNKLNNCVWNLEWVSHSENEKHAYATGLKNRFNGGTYAKGSNRIRRKELAGFGTRGK